MDLGDGLLFVLEKGKPKLILLNSGEKVQKNPVKPRPKLPGALSCRQPSRSETHTPPTEPRPIGKRIAELNGRSHQGKPGRGWGQTVTTSRAQENHAPGKEVKPKARVNSAKSQNAQRSNEKPEEPKKKVEQNAEPSNSSTPPPPDSEVCLTNERLQQILNAVQANDRRPNAEGIQAARVPEFVSRETKKSEETREETGNAPNKDRRSGGLPSWLEERPSTDRAALEAKKAQYKKELDEQQALKQKSHCSVPPKLQEDDTESLISVQSGVSNRDLPAAIRSSIRVGGFTPTDELVQEQAQEQRRQWLQELDKQREENSERKRLEKLRRRQPADQLLWMSHFDSLQRPPLAPLPCTLPPLPCTLPPLPCSVAPPPFPLAPPLGGDRGETGLSSRASQWDEASVRASVETSSSSSSSGGHGARASHLRTMTSLLDPTEIEERERRRLKKLEQQRAIELQVEERRRRREEEESLRKREEEEEERRLEQERRRMQRQYEIDSQRERYKEPEPGPELDPELDPGPESEPQSNTANHDERPELRAGSTPVNHHRDTGVQTEEVHISESCGPDSSGPASGPSAMDGAQVLHMLQMLHKGFGSDIYEPFARTEGSRTEGSRTEGSRTEGSRTEKRPEWNTQRPRRRFVPASQRYPEELQRQRQQSRLRRQAQLLSLQRNLNLNNTTTGQSLRPTLSPTEQSGPEAPRATGRAETLGQTSDGGRSPVHAGSPAPDFLPFLRTDEVFDLKPMETQRQTRHTAPAPQILQKTQRQQEIMRGLDQLRQGLLQKQRELESDLGRGRLDDGSIRPVSVRQQTH
ncbi:coiled-coil domain-containing protein 66 isoform X2 [Eucyclogobius newberryi]|uniref:coiled-coil domain-containing protein 66 isoform X2 n=1 Tax=Eucyclogobius newberryi TaxID=166745 RepID=UPI003B5A1396